MRSVKGFALMTVMMMVAVLMLLVSAYFMLTRIELSTTRSTSNQTSGFYAAEAGLNLRAEEIWATFQGYNRPAGTSPSQTDPCSGSNTGSGDFACKTYHFNGRRVETYVIEEPGNPQTLRIPPGEDFQNLMAQEYRYSIYSAAWGPDGQPEALLGMRFKSRLVPMFQFAAFYGKDLEVLPGPTMVLEGPVHSNGDLYLDAHNGLDILGQVTTAGDLFRGRKDSDTCSGHPVRVPDRTYNLRELPACSGRRRLIGGSELSDWGTQIQTHLEPLTLPAADALDPVPGKLYWDKADLRLVLDLTSATPAIKVFDPSGVANFTLTARLNSCPGTISSASGLKAVGYTHSLYNNRERKRINLLDVDLQSLLDCVHTQSLLIGGRGLDDTTEGGLVFYMTVKGPASSDNANDYGVRINNGADIASSLASAPAVRGLTIVTDQAVYVQGDYNAVDKKPAAFLADSLNVLSNNWDDAKSHNNLSQRVASDTTINAAFLAGTDFTGGADGSSGQDSGKYNGGLENYPRFHEKWTGKTLTYHGSFVSLRAPRHVNGAWKYGSPQYKAPHRDWHFDTDFNYANKLPPLTPRFVYLRQELFERKFEQ